MFVPYKMKTVKSRAGACSLGEGAGFATAKTEGVCHLENIVALLIWSISQCSLFFTSFRLCVSSTGRHSRLCLVCRLGHCFPRFVREVFTKHTQPSSARNVICIFSLDDEASSPTILIKIIYSIFLPLFQLFYCQ